METNAILENSSDPVRSLNIRDMGTGYVKEYKIPGWLIDPEKLVKVLRERFGDHYKVKLRNDNYSISIPEPLTKNELIMCN